MSHPKDRRERFLIGDRKGKRRGYRYWSGAPFKDPAQQEKHMERSAYLRRDTTKLCSCSMCTSPRKDPWCKDPRSMQEKRFDDAGDQS